jgi:hypothetical protein
MKNGCAEMVDGHLAVSKNYMSTIQKNQYFFLD